MVKELVLLPVGSISQFVLELYGSKGGGISL